MPTQIEGHHIKFVVHEGKKVPILVNDETGEAYSRDNFVMDMDMAAADRHTYVKSNNIEEAIAAINRYRLARRLLRRFNKMVNEINADKK